MRDVGEQLMMICSFLVAGLSFKCVCPLNAIPSVLRLYPVFHIVSSSIGEARSISRNYVCVRELYRLIQSYFHEQQSRGNA